VYTIDYYGKVFRLDPNVAPSQRKNNLNKWKFDESCLIRI